MNQTVLFAKNQVQRILILGHYTERVSTKGIALSL